MKKFNLDDHLRKPKDQYPFNPHDILGHGSYAIVYKGVAQTTGLPVAIKLIHFKLMSSLEEIEQAIFEGELLFKMSHPHIIKVIDLEITKDYMHIIMEVCESSLEKYLLINHEPDLKDVRI